MIFGILSRSPSYVAATCLFYEMYATWIGINCYVSQSFLSSSLEIVGFEEYKTPC